METPHLYYYYKKGLQPFRTVMDFSEDDLLAFMKTYLPEEKLFHKDPTHGLDAQARAADAAAKLKKQQEQNQPQQDQNPK